MSYSSREPYGAPVLPYQQAPSADGVGLPARALADGLAQVGNQFAAVWGAQARAEQVNKATAIASSKAMELDDMVRGFDADPDPATVPDRFRQKAAEWQQQSLEGLDAGIRRHVETSLTQMVPVAYRQVAGMSTRRTTATLQSALQTTLGTDAQSLAGAADEPSLQATVGRMKQAIAGNVAAGVIDQAASARLFSTTVRQAITIKAAADPLAAQAMLDRFKPEMDAGDVASLTTALRAPVEGRQDESAAQGAIGIPAEVRGRAEAVIQGLVARGLPMHVAVGLAANAVQESGANPAVRAGDGGASDGLFQWNGPRRAAFVAQYGMDPSKATLDQQLDFAVAELKGSESAAGTALLATSTAEDAARVGSTRYLRPRDTAAEERRRAGFATVLAGGSGRDLALADVRRQAEAEGLPLHRTLHREALVSQWFAREQAAQGQARAALSTDLRDLGAAYQTGQTTAEIPEGRIRSLLPPEQAQRTVDELQLARATGQTVQAVLTASPAEEAAMRARLQGNEGDTYMAAERQAAVQRFDVAMASKREALKDDPHRFAISNDPAVRALAQADAPIQQVAQASIEAQRRMGVSEGNLRILSNQQVAQFAEALRITGPETADLTPRLAALAEQFGPLWGRAYGELVHKGKVAWPVQALVGMTAPQQAEGRANLQAALRFVAERGPDALDKLIPADERKTIPAEVETALGDFAEATRHHPGGASFRATMQAAVDLQARWYASRGMKASDAASRAYQDVVGARWDTAGDDGSGFFGRTPTMLVPKGQAGRIETALDQVRGAIKPADLAPLADPTNPGATPQQLRDATLAAARRGLWINNADASGAVLKGRTPGGQIIDIIGADGRPIEVRFGELPATPAPIAATPAPGGATPLTDRQRRAFPLPPMLAR
jgi:hypothetical protein